MPSTSPADARSTSPSPSPASSTGAVAGIARKMPTGCSTSSTATCAGSGRSGGAASSSSSCSGSDGSGTFSAVPPKVATGRTPGAVPEQGPGLSGPGEVVALVLEVVAERDVAHAHEAGHRRDGDGVERVLLEATVEGVDEVGRRRRAVRDELAGDVGPVDEPGRDRVDGVAPPVRREVGARHLEHPCGPAVGRLAPARRGTARRRASTAAGPRAAGGSRPPCRRSRAGAGTGRPGRPRRRRGPVRAAEPGAERRRRPMRCPSRAARRGRGRAGARPGGGCAWPDRRRRGGTP